MWPCDIWSIVLAGPRLPAIYRKTPPSPRDHLQDTKEKPSSTFHACTFTPKYHQVISVDVQWKRTNSLLKFLTQVTIMYNAILLFYSSNFGADAAMMHN